MNRGYLSHCRFKNPKTFCVSKCNSIKKSSWNAHLEMPLFLNMPPKAASPKKEVLQKKDFKNFSTIVTSISRTSHKNNDYWFNNYYSNYDRGYCIYSVIKASSPSIAAKHRSQASQPSIAAKHRSQASSPSIAAKHRSQSCEQNNDNYTYPEMSDISIFELLWCFLNINE